MRTEQAQFKVGDMKIRGKEGKEICGLFKAHKFHEVYPPVRLKDHGSG